jgi:glyoxylase-like metal-dependent hydrolase (beta-lactamase superfamily II)
LALISEVAENLYEIQPEGHGLDRFPLCTVYLIVDEEIALVESGCSVQAQEIEDAVERILGDLDRLSYLALTHAHPDHAGAAAYLTGRLPNARVVAHPGAAKTLADPAMTAAVMQGFKMTFGETTEERLGVMLPVASERFLSLQDGECVSLGKRELKAIHTPGHDPHHLCFLDTLTGGVFCGDTLGGYISEIDVLVPPHVPGTDFHGTLNSIAKLQAVRPSQLFFSHGCAVRDGARYLQIAEDNLRNCQKAAYEAIQQGKSITQVAHALIDVMSNNSPWAKSELLKRIHLSVMGAESYRSFFKRKHMI